MAYAEFLRARRSLTWHVAILAAITLLILYFANPTTIHVDGLSTYFPGMQVPLGGLADIGMVFAAIYASGAGTSLNRESTTRDLSWTKPIPRTLLALQFVLIDLAAITIVFVLAMLAVAAVLLRLHMVPVFDTGFVPEAALGLGVAAMWYGLVQLLSFWFPSGARAVGGILWPIAFVVAGLTKLPGPLGAIMGALDVLNPLAYVSDLAKKGASQSLAGSLSLDARVLAVWVFVVLFCTIAVTLWPRKEA